MVSVPTARHSRTPGSGHRANVWVPLTVRESKNAKFGRFETVFNFFGLPYRPRAVRYAYRNGIRGVPTVRKLSFAH
ncbi:hypothetical protein BHE74_00040999 [Ensete ventricosum]|nr:hypothetical protein BHE74_00040999 [Ensete ventricosum]